MACLYVSTIVEMDKDDFNVYPVSLEGSVLKIILSLWFRSRGRRKVTHSVRIVMMEDIPSHPILFPLI